MKRSTLLLASSLGLLACSGRPVNADAGTDAGAEEVIFKVSGTVKTHPLAVAYLKDAGSLADGGSFLPDGGDPASIVGLLVRVEEPLKVALFNPEGVFGTLTLDATGAFEVGNISSEAVTLGVAAGVLEANDGGSRVVRAATIVFDVALEQGKPRGDVLAATGYAVPLAFHDKLTEVVTPATISGLTSPMVTRLIEAGFILGRVLDASGNPVAGATMTPSPANLGNRFFYPNATLTGLGTSTSSTGLFVYLHNANDVNTFRFTVAGDGGYKLRNAGATKDACLVVDVRPTN